MRKHLHIGWLKSYGTHRRVTAFWAVALLALTVPWVIKGCQMTPEKTGLVHEDCAVLSIYDGDTMTVRCDGEKIKVRLYCIDAPEMAQKPWGKMSRDHLRKTVERRVDIKIIDHDRYRRAVAEVSAGTVNLNLRQVNKGWAAVYDRYCKSIEYKQAERAAASSGLGIWGDRGLQQTPWIWRKNKGG